MGHDEKDLAEIGGWEAMADYHSDDLTGEPHRRNGYRVELIASPSAWYFHKSRSAFFRS